MTQLDDAGYVTAQYRDVARRTSALEGRATAPLLAYARSMQGATGAASESSLARFAAHVEREIARCGALHMGIAARLVTGRP